MDEQMSASREKKLRRELREAELSSDIVKKVNHQIHSLFVRDLQTFVCKNGWFN